MWIRGKHLGHPVPLWNKAKEENAACEKHFGHLLHPQEHHASWLTVDNIKS